MATITARKLARLLVLLLLLAGLGLVLFLSTRDLNRYRDDIADAVSRLFDRPVHFSSIAFSLKDGLAIDLRELEVPALPGRADHLATHHLYFKVRILPLLRGQIRLRKVLIDQPDLTIDLSREQAKEGASASPAGEANALAQTGIQEVRISKGNIRLLLPGQTERPITLGDADLTVAATTDSRLKLTLSGLLLRDTFQSTVRLAGLVSGKGPSEWLVRPVDLELVLNQFPLDVFGRDLGENLPHPAGTVDVRGHLTGNLKNGYRVGLQLTGDTARLIWNKRPSLPLDGLRLRGLWRPAGNDQRFEDFELLLPQGQVKGTLRYADRRLAGTVRLSIADLTRFSGWLPKPLQVSSGDMKARFDLSPAPLDALPPTLLDHVRGTVTLTRIAGRLGDLPPVRNGLIRADIDSRTITLDEAWFELWEQVQALSGQWHIKEDSSSLALTAELKLPLKNLADRLWAPASLKTTGLARIRAQITGEMRQPAIAVNADLSEAEMDLNGWFRKHTGEPARLTGTIARTEKGWNLTDGQLSLGQNHINLSGSLAASNQLQVHLRGTGLDLERLASSRHLGRHHISGQAGMDLRLTRQADSPLEIHGRVSLDDAGVHLTSVVADLAKIRGQVLFKGRGFESLPLSARLGSSPVTIRVGMKSFDAPALKLHLQGKKVRTSELVFHNPDNHLNNLDGRITIDGRGIRFDRVEVHLDGGTDCVVTGAMSGWHQPRVDLKARASYTNVDEVIALWTRGSKKEQPKASADRPKRPGTKVVVKAETDHGRIGRFNFDHATATITSDGAGRLGVFPLHFRAGSGQGTGQVLADNREKGPGRLRISGHLEDFPAAAIHRELLQQKSIVDGTLRGDFFLEGETGAFLQTVGGGAHLEIRNGVLNRFTVLAKIFSLLNVSQIFSFQLPDMVQNGMPFDSLTASIAIDKGRLHTENLLIHGEAMDMSMVGSYDMPSAEIDALAALKPLRTVDKILTKIPIAGWILGGKEKSLVTAQFRITGPAGDPKVDAIPISSVSRKVLGIFKRVLTLPGEVLMDPGKVLLPQSSKPE